MSTASLLLAAALTVFLAPTPALEIDARRDEATLLHRSIDLRGLRVRPAKSGKWQSRPPAPARVTVLHVWAVECPPCVAEMPVLREVSRAFERTEPGVRFVFVTETLEEDRLLAFLRAQAKNLPDGDVYQSADGRLRRSLQTDKQPITLLLDRDSVVRQAFVGSVAERRNELVEAIERLLAVAK